MKSTLTCENQGVQCLRFPVLRGEGWPQMKSESQPL